MSFTSNPIYFLHIGKTGGTSLDSLMMKHLSRSHRKYFGKLHFDWSYIQKKQKENALSHRVNVEGIDDHEGYNDVYENADVITFLRHPMSRAISQFHFSQTLRWAKKQNAQFIHMTFDEWIKNPGTFRQPIAEVAVEFLAGLSGKGGYIKTDEVNSDFKKYLRQNRTAACLLAAERLDKTTWFGILEDVDRSMKLLQLTMDWDETPTMKKLNRGPKKNPQPSEEALAKVREYLPQDLWLYEYAQRLFEARWDYFTNANGNGTYIHPQLPPLPKFEDAH